MTLPKSIQPKNNKSYDGLITVVTDHLVCAKLKFAEMLLWKFMEEVFKLIIPWFLFSVLLWRDCCDGY